MVCQRQPLCGLRPFGHWRTQTFIAGLRCHGLTAPWIVDAPLNSRIFETWIDTQLAPTLSPGDVVILDNVGFHKSEKAEQLVRATDAWLLFLPPHSPDLNPHRNGVLKAQGALTKASRQKLRCDNPCARRYHRSLLCH
ncbi:transposase [Rhizobium sp. RU35A]|uniref:transposase n=1 Tax=Rhizobium sp. RU35A TaxID=1907414 RepID=UPI001FCE8172|nr:transposase [Rhizobium sp. RU35A]